LHDFGLGETKAKKCLQRMGENPQNPAKNLQKKRKNPQKKRKKTQILKSRCFR